MNMENLSALATTRSGLLRATKRRQACLTEMSCRYCHKKFKTRKRGRTTTVYCSRSCAAIAVNARIDVRSAISKALKKPIKPQICEYCGRTFIPKNHYGAKNRLRFCGNTCAAKWRMAQPGRKEICRVVIKTAQASNVGRRRPDAAQRMRERNPMADPVAREKMRQKLIGRTFLARGGNGTLTTQQKLVADALGLPTEYIILTHPVAEQFKSLPHCYKVDIADPIRKIAIEIDGKTHKLKLWRFLDHRKTEVLRALGWLVVLRFWNEEVIADLPRVLQEIAKRRI